MSWNGAGTFNRLYSWVADAAAGLNISSSRIDADTNDIASNGFGNCLTRDGQGGAIANLPMAGNRHTGVGNGVARTDYAALGQVQDGLINWVVAAGTADALIATYTPAIASLSDGELFFVRASAANTIASPTFNPNGLGAHNISKFGGNVLSVGDIQPNLELIMRWRQATSVFEWINGGDRIPVGSIFDFAGATAPGGYLLCGGQDVSRTTYAALFAVIGTTYGAGNGTTTFTLPDLRGRVAAGKDDMNGSAANRITNAGSGVTGTTLGASGGSQNHTLTTAELPVITPTGSISISDTRTWNIKYDVRTDIQGTVSGVSAVSSASSSGAQTGTGAVVVGSGTISGTFSGTPFGSGNAHATLPPVLILNKIIKT